MTIEKKKMGRPRKYVGRRPTWTVRLEEKYGDQIRDMAQTSGRSMSEVCEQQIINSFRYAFIIDLLEADKEKLTAELQEFRIASNVALARLDEAEKRNAELIQRMEMMMRARSTKYRFGRPIKEKSK